MAPPPVHIAGIGVVSALGCGLAEHVAGLKRGARGITPLTCFQPQTSSTLPVGEVAAPLPNGSGLPRTHVLARIAADQAMINGPLPVDAVVVGTTTGGMPLTEKLLRNGETDPAAYRHHGAGTVGDDLAERFGCRGPVITVSTACASGTAAIALASAMVSAGIARRVLVGGADGLCRMTYYGFNALQLVDPEGARPLDVRRRGLSVAEGAGMLLLTSDADQSIGVAVLGTGLSCDAYHPTTPHPRGDGAVAAMQRALADAGVSADAIDYVNLHGTGTPDNDRVEALAVDRVFRPRCPPVSSIKGATGHALAAAGAIEAVVAALCVTQGFIPANTGGDQPDPGIALSPLKQPMHRQVKTVLSNSFGFGGSNAAVVVGRSPEAPITGSQARTLADLPGLWVAGASCITGSGGLTETLDACRRGSRVAGVMAADRLSNGLPRGLIRRLKRLPRMALALAAGAVADRPGNSSPRSIFFASGWGGQSETYDFLTRLFETEERFPSPTDFINSVHNAPAGHAAQHLGATGANVTTSGGDTSFEQALLSAMLLSEDADLPLLVMGADEYCPTFTAMLDPSAAKASRSADGGGALLLQRTPTDFGAIIRMLWFQRPLARAQGVAALIEALGGATVVCARYASIMVNIPGALRSHGEALLKRFLDQSGFAGTVLDIRRSMGEFATVTAAATAVAAGMVAHDRSGKQLGAGGQGVLLLSFTEFVTALEVFPQ